MQLSFVQRILLRIALIPVVYVLLIALFITAPFLVLFGKIKYKGEAI